MLMLEHAAAAIAAGICNTIPLISVYTTLRLVSHGGDAAVPRIAPLTNKANGR